jgi:hypothetical protein
MTVKSKPKSKPEPAVEPLVVRPSVARRMLGDCSQDEIYRKLGNGDLESYLDGRRRLITVESIKQDIMRKAQAAVSAGFQRARGSRMPA